MYQGYKELEVWKLSMRMVLEVYKVTKNLPNDERYGISSQMKRAAVSVPSNIAEGHSRFHNKAFIQFLRIAQGSCSELNTLVLLATVLEMIKKQDVVLLQDKIDHISRMIARLISSLEKKI